jgi:hypothetical protein
MRGSSSSINLKQKYKVLQAAARAGLRVFFIMVFTDAPVQFRMEQRILPKEPNVKTPAWP